MAEIHKEEERKWTREQIEQYKRVLPRYSLYAETLQKVLEKAGKKCATLAIVQTRPKTIASFAEKSLRKRHKYKDPVNQFTDLCGARVITRTPDEVKAVCEFIETHFDIDWENSIDVSQRLRPTEFGYRSTHYIVKFEPDIFPTKDIDVVIPDAVFGLKAEIQVRTLLEHTWADFTHSTSYKGAFRIPEKWERELAALAAVLEDADSSFERIGAGLQAYAASYGAYMTEEQTRYEIDVLEIVLEHDPENLELAARIGKLAITLGDWQKAIGVLSRYTDSEYQPILRDLGVAMCKMYGANRDSEEYRQGQKYLEAAAAPPSRDSDAIASLAGTWKGIDEDKARELYRQAFEIDPSDPYPLGNYLEYEVIRHRDTSMVSLLRPVINAAIHRCRDQASVGMNLPWAFYDIGKFYLLLGMPYESFAAYSKAVQLSTAAFMIDTSLQSLDKLAVIRDSLPGYEWARRLLILGRATKFPSEEWIDQVKKLTSTGREPITGPVIIVVGGYDPSVEQQMQGYRDLMLEAFRDFEGTIISGGTTAGIGGVVGEVGQKCANSVRTIGYVPKENPEDVSVDKRYGEIRYTEASSFSPAEPLQYWSDIIASRVQPSQVRLLAINGGAIAAAEYRMALALGATVAVLKDSGHEAAKLLTDDDWRTSKTLIRLPADSMTVRVFLGSVGLKMAPDIRGAIAQEIHKNYQIIRASSVQSADPAMADWDRLPDYLQESNRQQADHIYEKLRRIGCTVHEVTDRNVVLITFTRDEIDIMAEMEHARWNVERLLDGWTWAEERDVNKKTSPYLVGFSELPEEVKEWDREPVRKIPEFLAKIGLEVRRQ